MFSIVYGISLILISLGVAFIVVNNKNRFLGYLVYYTIINKKACLKIQLYSYLLWALCCFFVGIMIIITQHIEFSMYVFIFGVISSGAPIVICKRKGYIEK